MSHADEHENSTTITVEEAAIQRAEAAADLARAEEEAERLRVPYEAAQDEVRVRWKRLREIDEAMGAVAAGHRIRDALDAAGIKFDGPLMVSWDIYQGRGIALLAAVGPEGTGLYIYKPDRAHRYLMTQRVVRVEDAAKHDVTEQPYEGHHYSRADSSQTEAGLYAWQARTRGDFGMNGAYSPLPPPEGGRWRWLKVKDGKALEPGR